MDKTQQQPIKYLPVHQSADVGSLLFRYFAFLKERLPNLPEFVIALRCGQLSIRTKKAMPKLFPLRMTYKNWNPDI